MISLVGSAGGQQWRDLFSRRSDLGIMIGPNSWRRPFGRYACDNDVFRNSIQRSAVNGAVQLLPLEARESWWYERGEAAWLKMLDKIPTCGNRPMFVVLPDAVADWERTKERAQIYRPELWRRSLRSAIALQDGCDTEEEYRWIYHQRFGILFVGGSTGWKWRNVAKLRERFPAPYYHLHVGRVNGARRLHYCQMIGVDSTDGTGVNRHSRALLPEFLGVLDGEEPQRRLFTKARRKCPTTAN